LTSLTDRHTAVKHNVVSVAIVVGFHH